MNYITNYNDLICIRKSIYNNEIINYDVKNFGLYKLTKLIPYNLKYILDARDVKGIPFVGTHYTPHKHRYLFKIIPIIKELPVVSYVEMLYLELLSSTFLETHISPCVPLFYRSIKDIPNTAVSIKNKLPFQGINKVVELYPRCNVLISEYISDTDIIDLFEKKIVNDDLIKSIIFQIIYTLAVFQDSLQIVHGDLHLSNILLTKDVEQYKFLKMTYKGKTYYVKCFGYIPKIIDFECMISYSKKEEHEQQIISENNLDKNFLFNGDVDMDRMDCMDCNEVSEFTDSVDEDSIFDPHIDMHFFLKELLKIKSLPIETIEFIKSIYPHELIDIESEESSYANSKTFECETHYIYNGKLKPNVGSCFELQSPEQVLNHPYFTDSYCKTIPPLRSVIIPEFKYD